MAYDRWRLAAHDVAARMGIPRRCARPELADARATLNGVDEDFQNEEELASHYGPDGPVVAALAWLHFVLGDDLKAAWAKTDPNFRLVLAQAFLWANRAHPVVIGHDLEKTAQALASLAFNHDLWLSFEETQLADFHKAFDDFFAGNFGAGSRPRPVGLDLEIVKFVRTESDAPMLFTEPTMVRAHVLLLHATSNEWLVAGRGVDTPPVPGWPPTPGHPSY